MRSMLGITVLVAAISTNSQGFVTHSTRCSSVMCRPGRECQVVSTGDNKCVCKQKCTDHWKPVCGSDGHSYDSHCQLHKTACLKDLPISPLHSGFCRKDREMLIERQEFIKQISKIDETEKFPRPTACLENERERMREFIINWFQLSAHKKDWYSQGMSYGEEVWGHFYGSDVSKDGYLDSSEMLQYINNNKTGGYYTQNQELRQLCLDALVEEGDTNFDWRLSFEEFKHLLSESYKPSSKHCNLNGEMHEDGAETQVECNGCVCACGKWICTSEKCSQGYQDIFINKLEQENYDDEDDSFEYDDEDDFLDNNDLRDIDDDDLEPEDDPDVQDINWF